jgi:hypothetical protein
MDPDLHRKDVGTFNLQQLMGTHPGAAGAPVHTFSQLRKRATSPASSFNTSCAAFSCACSASIASKKAAIVPGGVAAFLPRASVKK